MVKIKKDKIASIISATFLVLFLAFTLINGYVAASTVLVLALLSMLVDVFHESLALAKIVRFNMYINSVSLAFFIYFLPQSVYFLIPIIITLVPFFFYKKEELFAWLNTFTQFTGGIVYVYIFNNLLFWKIDPYIWLAIFMWFNSLISLLIILIKYQNIYQLSPVAQKKTDLKIVRGYFVAFTIVFFLFFSGFSGFAGVLLYRFFSGLDPAGYLWALVFLLLAAGTVYLFIREERRSYDVFLKKQKIILKRMFSKNHEEIFFKDIKKVKIRKEPGQPMPHIYLDLYTNKKIRSVYLTGKYKPANLKNFLSVVKKVFGKKFKT